MGSVCACGSGKKKSVANNVKNVKKVKLTSNKTQSTAISGTTTKKYSSNVIPDSNFNNTDIESVDVHVVPVYKPHTDHDKTVLSKSSAPSSSDAPLTTTNIHSSPKIVNDHLKNEILKSVDEHDTSISTSNKNESASPVVSKTDETLLSAAPDTTSNIRSSREAVNDNLKDENVDNTTDTKTSTTAAADESKPEASEATRTPLPAESETTTDNLSSSDKVDNDSKTQNAEGADKKEATPITADKIESEEPSLATESTPNIDNFSPRENLQDGSETNNTEGTDAEHAATPNTTVADKTDDETPVAAAAAPETSEPPVPVEPTTTTDNVSPQEDVKDTADTANAADADEKEASITTDTPNAADIDKKEAPIATDKKESEPSETTESDETQASDNANADADTPSPVASVLNNDFKAEITKAVDERIPTYKTNFESERERIVEEMKKIDPEPYLGLTYSDYPNNNYTAVNKMARELVGTEETKKELIDQVHDHIRPSISSRTAEMDTLTRGLVHPLVKKHIEEAVNDAFDRFGLE